MSQPKARTRLTWKRVVGYVISIAIVVAIYRDDGPKARPEMVLAGLG